MKQYNETRCALCRVFGEEYCSFCPLCLSGDRCFNPGSTYKKYIMAISTPEQIDAMEAMLEALVMLLPTEERERYGG
jgi:hypothetical protein